MKTPATQPLMSAVHRPSPPPRPVAKAQPASQPARQVVYVVQPPRAAAVPRSGAVCPMCQGTRWKVKKEVNFSGFVLALIVLSATVPAVVMAAGFGSQTSPEMSIAYGSAAGFLGIVLAVWISNGRHFRQCRGCGYRYQTK